MANRSKKFIFVPFCLMAQAYQAQGIVKYEWKSSIKPIMQLLIDNDINIIQMPCTEASFNDSLIREPKGLSKYNTDEFNEHCQKKADQVIYEIKNIINSGYEVIAILGIEHSPSCCANYIYTNKGNEKRKGIFIEKIYDGLKEYNIPIIGINRKYIRKSLMELEKVIKGSDNNG
ncbi:MAG: hypothetical protein PUJ60_04510 [bacterium]|nr:hypothetical protein [bacterium]MDY4108348.1 hypothetical protein [Bacilli bacterium]